MTRARPTTYSFRSAWTVTADRRELYDRLEDVAGYPQWWPQVRAVRIDDDTALVACRSLLPYTLHFVMRPRRRDREGGVLEAALDGDLVGWCRWLLSTSGQRTDVVFEQEVSAPGLRVGPVEPLVRPLLVLNHHRMMAGGRRGLAGTSAH